MEQKILWLKWIDPFEDNDDVNIEDEQEEEEDRPYYDSYEKLEHKQEEIQKKMASASSNAGPLLVGPMGIIPINESNQPSKVFNFWMAHTNFDIGDNETEILETTPGVETLDVFTRYRVRISIGRAFDEDEVMDTIEKRLCPKQEKTETTASVVSATHGLDKMRKYLTSKYKYWVIFVLPDGQLDYQTGDTKDDIKEKISTYPKPNINILTSWEVNNDSDQTSKKNSNGPGVQRGSCK